MLDRRTLPKAQVEYERAMARLIRMELEEREIQKDLVAPYPDDNSSADSLTA